MVSLSQNVYVRVIVRGRASAFGFFDRRHVPLESCGGFWLGRVRTIFIIGTSKITFKKSGRGQDWIHPRRVRLVKDEGGVQPYVLWLGAALHLFMVGLILAAIEQEPPDGEPWDTGEGEPNPKFF